MSTDNSAGRLFLYHRKDLSQLHYLTSMFIKESMHLHPLVPGTGQYLYEPLTFPINKSSKMTVSGKCNLIMPIFPVHRNPDVWKEPEVSTYSAGIMHGCRNHKLELIVCFNRSLIRIDLPWRTSPNNHRTHSSPFQLGRGEVEPVGERINKPHSLQLCDSNSARTECLTGFQNKATGSFKPFVQIRSFSSFR